MSTANSLPAATSYEPGCSRPAYGGLWRREFRLDRRFSVGVVLGWMTLAGIAFGVCELLHASIDVYIRVLSLGAATIIFQLIMPRRPRTACAWAGLFVSLAWVVPQQSFWAPFGIFSISSVVADMAGVAIFGALIGYLVGAVATGVPLLVAELLRIGLQPQPLVEGAPWGEAESAVDGLPPTAAATLAEARRARQAGRDTSSPD